MSDPDGRKGLGVSHWVAYNIPPTVTSLAAGEGTNPSAAFTSGKNVAGAALYRGACPPAGDTPHHYLLTVYALDIAPTLPAGLDREELFKAIGPHIIRTSSIVARFAR